MEASNGDSSSQSSQWSFTYDTADPSVSASYFPERPSVVDIIKISSSASDSTSGLSSIKLELIGSTNTVLADCDYAGEKTGTCEFNGQLPAGLNHVQATAYDRAGHSSSEDIYIDVMDAPMYCRLAANGKDYIIVNKSTTVPVQATCYDTSNEEVQCPDMQWSSSYSYSGSGDSITVDFDSNGIGSIRAQAMGMYPCSIGYIVGSPDPKTSNGLDMQIVKTEYFMGEKAIGFSRLMSGGVPLPESSYSMNISYNRSGFKNQKIDSSGERTYSTISQNDQVFWLKNTSSWVFMLDTKKYYGNDLNPAYIISKAISGSEYTSNVSYTVISPFSIDVDIVESTNGMYRITKSGDFNVTRGDSIHSIARVKKFGYICPTCNVEWEFTDSGTIDKSGTMQFSMDKFHSWIDTENASYPCSKYLLVYNVSDGIWHDDYYKNLYLDCHPVISVNPQEVSTTVGSDRQVSVTVYNPSNSHPVSLSAQSPSQAIQVYWTESGTNTYQQNIDTFGSGTAYLAVPSGKKGSYIVPLSASGAGGTSSAYVVYSIAGESMPEMGGTYAPAIALAALFLLIV